MLLLVYINTYRTRISTKYHASDKAYLSVKTYDPISGICLRFRTDRAVDISRLMAAVCTLGCVMANIEELQTKIEQADVAEQIVEQIVEQTKKHKKRR
ncbi:hypothetical protein PORY_000020 [Pneumocystis oryctolagi]|uniref:Uncharacterized protein n=1 Tax=Pneumocystis oryctolagi TaxID=42067 RepID=A0ACB7CE32_9ASCO|nr:hypothetical protein PORY_000020 [Pneumocystis oryctolagi]